MKNLSRENYLVSKIKNNRLLQIITCIVLSSFVIGFYIIFSKITDTKNYQKYSLEKDIKLINKVENMKIENDVLKLEGYAFYLNRNSSNSSISIFLKNISNNNEIWMDTETISREDIQNYYNCEFNYEHSGYIATTRYNKLNISKVYEIFLNIDTYDENGKIQRKTVTTNRYLYNEELLTYNPYDFVQPDINVQSELLKRIFKEGLLRFYRKDVGIYIYEYQNKLYWVADNNFQFDEEGRTYIPYQLWTSQLNKLPENRIQYGYDNLDFVFENFEIKEENTVPYRVAVRDIPDNYAITYALTGVYDLNENKLLWHDYFFIN